MSPTCFVCGHDNPPGSKYCSQCGSPLHDGRGNECNAINDDGASSGFKCGTDLAVQDSPIARSESLIAELEIAYGSSDPTNFAPERKLLNIQPVEPERAVVHKPRAEASGFLTEVIQRFARVPFARTALSVPPSNHSKLVDGKRIGTVLLAPSHIDIAMLTMFLGAATVITGYVAYWYPMNDGAPTSAQSVPTPQNDYAASVAAQETNPPPGLGEAPGSNPDTTSTGPALLPPQQRFSTAETAEQASGDPVGGSATPQARAATAPTPAHRPISRVASNRAAARVITDVDVLRPPVRNDKQNAADQWRQDACTEQIAVLGLCDQSRGAKAAPTATMSAEDRVKAAKAAMNIP